MRIALSYVSVPVDNLGVNVGAGLEDTENSMLPESSGSVRECLSDPIRTVSQVPLRWTKGSGPWRYQGTLCMAPMVPEILRTCSSSYLVPSQRLR